MTQTQHTATEWTEITANGYRHRIRKQGDRYEVEYYSKYSHEWMPLKNEVISTGFLAAAFEERAQLTQAIEALRSVEWIHSFYSVNTDDDYCPHCKQYRRYGHDTDCAISTVLQQYDTQHQTGGTPEEGE